MRQETLERVLLAKGFSITNRGVFVSFIRKFEEFNYENPAVGVIPILESVDIKTSTGKVERCVYFDGEFDENCHWVESIEDLYLDVESNELFVKKFLL